MIRTVAFLAGVAAGALAGRRRKPGSAEPSAAELRRRVIDLEVRFAANRSETSERMARVESRLEEHAARLADVPSTAQIVCAMEQVLAKSMASLDDRLANQAHSIEVLRDAVTQTDSLLERVLESVDSLQPYSEAPALSATELLHPSPV